MNRPRETHRHNPYSYRNTETDTYTQTLMHTYRHEDTDTHG